MTDPVTEEREAARTRLIETIAHRLHVEGDKRIGERPWVQVSEHYMAEAAAVYREPSEAAPRKVRRWA